MNTVMEIGAFEAKTHLSELLEKVGQGKTFHITKRGRPMAELRPIAVTARHPRFGADKGTIKIQKDFDAPIPEMETYTE